VIALSICIPTFERPDLLRRALQSISDATGDANEVEILVSDDSQDDRSARICEAMFAQWPGRARRIENRPKLGLVGNFNRCVAAASGRHILILHDDDYLLPGAVAAVLLAAKATPMRHVMLFGVDVVDMSGRLRRRQSFRREIHLKPEDALLQVISNSSYVRFPGIVVAADAYAAVGPFDTAFGGTTDLDMWIRLFRRFGVECLQPIISAYSVHDEAHTAGMFNPDTIASVLTIFDRVAEQHVVPQHVLRHCEADFLAQFILGGAYRHLRRGDRSGARKVMQLFDLPPVRSVGPSRRWWLIRLAIGALMRAPGPLDVESRLLERLYPDASILWPR